MQLEAIKSTASSNTVLIRDGRWSVMSMAFVGLNMLNVFLVNNDNNDG